MTARAFLLALFAALLVNPAYAQDEVPPASQRPTVVVADLDTDRTGWVPPPRLGATLAELLTDRLVSSGQYRLLDRETVAAVAGRGPMPFAVLRDRAAAAGGNYLIVGAVTRFSTERQRKTGVGLLPVPVVGGLVRKNKVEFVIGLTLRVIDVRTGEVVATATTEGGAATQNSSSGGIAVVGLPVPIAGGGGSSTTGAQDRLLDTAIVQAIDAAAERIIVQGRAWRSICCESAR
jgi:curli biogenesis system outer membrane secretion channel CsgG